MSSDYWRVPVADLKEIKTKLESIEQLVSGVEPNAFGSEGVDSVHGHEITAEVTTFYEEWKQSRKTLLENVRILGEASGTISDAVNKFDSQTRDALQGMADQLSGAGEG